MAEEKQNPQNNGGNTGKSNTDEKALESAILALRQYQDTAEDKRKSFTARRDKALAGLPQDQYDDFVGRINDARKFGASTISFNGIDNIQAKDVDLSRLSYWRKQNTAGKKDDLSLKEEMLGTGLKPIVKDLKDIAGIKDARKEKRKSPLRQDLAGQEQKAGNRPTFKNTNPANAVGSPKEKTERQSDEIVSSSRDTVAPEPQTIEKVNLDETDVFNDERTKTLLGVAPPAAQTAGMSAQPTNQQVRRQDFTAKASTQAQEVDKGRDDIKTPSPSEDAVGPAQAAAPNLPKTTTASAGDNPASGTDSRGIKSAQRRESGTANGANRNGGQNTTRQASAKVETKTTGTVPLGTAATRKDPAIGKTGTKTTTNATGGPNQQRPVSEAMNVPMESRAERRREFAVEATTEPSGHADDINIEAIDQGWGAEPSQPLNADIRTDELGEDNQGRQDKVSGIKPKSPTLRGMPTGSTKPGKSAKSQQIGPQAILPPIEAAMRLGEMQQQARTSNDNGAARTNRVGGDTKLEDTYSQALDTEGGTGGSSVMGNFVYSPLEAGPIARTAQAPGSMIETDETAADAGGGYLESGEEERARVLAEQQQGARLAQSMAPGAGMAGGAMIGGEPAASTQLTPEEQAQGNTALQDENEEVELDETEQLMDMASRQTRARSLQERAQEAQEAVQSLKDTAEGTKKFLDLAKTGSAASFWMILVAWVILNVETLWDMFKKTQGKVWKTREYIMFGLTVFSDCGVAFMIIANLMIWLWPFVLVLGAAAAIVAMSQSGMSITDMMEFVSAFR